MMLPFVDSPRVDVILNLDKWIDKHCLDADVSVLVVNAVSTITNTVSFSYLIFQIKQPSYPVFFVLSLRAAEFLAKKIKQKQ